MPLPSPIGTIRKWHAPAGWGMPDSNPGLQNGNQVRYHWATTLYAYSRILSHVPYPIILKTNRDKRKWSVNIVGSYVYYGWVEMHVYSSVIDPPLLLSYWCLATHWVTDHYLPPPIWWNTESQKCLMNQWRVSERVPGEMLPLPPPPAHPLASPAFHHT